jgi:HTH-type transcriptional regulator / antitoxin HigA
MKSTSPNCSKKGTLAGSRHRSACPSDDIGTDAARILPVWPIRTKEHYLQAREIVDKLAVKGEEELTAAERDQLEIFCVLMEKYEDEHYPLDQPTLSPIELLKLLVQESGMSSSDLGRLLGDRSLGYKILNGERNLSKAHIRILSEHFRVNANAFL